ncbi:hypothetical protein FACS1894190_15940 [Spirochaetia bacterium]|nr:hypothetical protein FACS1894190_15940 [Spirochaetia bacterium]
MLKDFAQALAIPVGLTDSLKWPVRAGSVIFPIRNLLVNEFISQIEASGIIGKPDEWRRAFDGPTQLWRMSHHLISGLVDDKVEKSVIADRILLLLEGIAALNNDHYFEKTGAHYIFSGSEVAEVASSFKSLEKATARKLLMLSGLLWAYSETNYFVAHELTCEYHGAYKLADDTYAVVREFKNLRPTQLWSNRDFNGLPEYIRVITFHDKSLQIQFDVYNNLFDEAGTMAPSITGGYAIADGKQLSYDEILSLIVTVSEKVTAFTEEVNALSKQEIAHKYKDIFWYRKKSLADYMGVGWRPSDEIAKTLDEGLAAGQPAAPKSASSLSPVEKFAIEYDFSEYVK